MATASVQTKQPSILGWLDENFEKIFLVVGLLSIICFITLQTVYRYVVSSILETAGAMVWTEEVSRYIFIWITYLALCVAVKKRSSIRIDIIYDKLPRRWQEISWVVVHGCFLLLTLVIAITGWSQIERLLRFPQYTTATRIPFLIPYLVLPVGFGLMSLRLVQDLWRQCKKCGTRDSLIGVAAFLALGLPMYPVMLALYVPDLPVLYDYIAPLPALFGYFVVMCVIGVPIAIGLGLSSLATIICADTLPMQYLSQVAFTSLDNFPIMAIPFFIAAGVFMGAGGLSNRLLTLADEMIGGLYGGMALTTVVTCMFFGAISGSGPATVAAIGSLTIPAMLERGYDRAFACAIVASAGALGVMIPPSNPFVVYGISAQVSIGDLFISGIIPGVLCSIVLM
ncbi:MAG: TRAP transporter large permease subunit, partial [Desulfovibrionaceae bacterium]|nr:TRAP transporter large permease subunit [Desulfovibrionaceae bacterium]